MVSSHPAKVLKAAPCRLIVAHGAWGCGRGEGIDGVAIKLLVHGVDT